jgi:hypothetical protein
MKSSPAPPGAPNNSVDTNETGLPGLRTWRGVYLVVLGTFMLWVALLAALEKFFS